MLNESEVLWINTNPSFKRFGTPLIRYLSRQMKIWEWEYIQTCDEPSSLEIPLTLLHDYIKNIDHPLHLIGHGTGGLVALLYARRHPERVKSLTLLGVGVYPAVDWQAQYYALRELLPCSREVILGQMVKNIFGTQQQYNTKALIQVLENDLNTSVSPHSIYQRFTVPSGGVSMPLMVCGSEDDLIVDRQSLHGWKTYFKAGDRVWESLGGYHFFHYYYPCQVGREILDFWRSSSDQNKKLVVNQHVK